MSSSLRPHLIERTDDLSADWLSAVIGQGAVSDFRVDRIGTGQMSECYRVTLRYADGETGPDSVVLKIAAADGASRQTGAAMGLYEREVRFYTDIAPALDGPVAHCYHAAYDADSAAFDLVLSDAAPAVTGDEIRGASPDQARLALTQLGLIHGRLLGNDSLEGADWINRDSPVNQDLISALYAGFIDRYQDRVAAEHRTVCERFIEVFDDYMAEQNTADAPRGLIHGDFRLDNMLFGTEGSDQALTVLDWQTVTWGPAFSDVAYFLGCALRVEDRRAHYDALLAAYHDALGPAAGVTLADVREGVRRQTFFGVLMSIVSSMLVERTERGDDMFMAMLERHCQQVLDTDALAILPAPSAPEPPLQPTAQDEGRHESTDEPLWSESWYFDFVDTGQNLGGWIRLGLIPNQGNAWINALLCGPDMPTVALLDFEAPLPTDHTRTSGDGVEVTFDVAEPLQTFRVTVTGRGQAFDDPAELLSGGAGRPVEATMDLTWRTVGTPYQYRMSPRYEIPCRVTGIVTVDGRRFEIDEVVGQRDHSWASRDWWSMDWMWSALHLDDGTHEHAVEIHIPGLPALSVGYLQSENTPLVELQKVTPQSSFDGELPVRMQLSCTPGDFAASFEVRAHAPVLLTSADGRVSRFPRAWGTVTTADGRTGVGWVEWNRSQAG
ncbi:phosphotransferase [Mycolicibacterium vaccae]|uniref:DUF7064 domain-containing protein n=1 Tax=Mycolicibacterium vaccae TaxID=1810 RepID=UPI003CF81BDB